MYVIYALMKVLRGKPVSQRIDSELKLLSEKIGAPTLVVYLVNGDRSSAIYARSKIKKGEKIGAKVILREYSKDVSIDELEMNLSKDATDPAIHGIMIERPLPDGIDIHELMKIVPSVKDVEGLHPENYGLLGMGDPRFIAPTPLGALLLMLHYGVEIKGSEVVVVGRSPNVGRPLATLLSQKVAWGNATVTLVHSRTKDIGAHTKRADIVITAVGRSKMLKGDMVKEGAILIDLGINPEGNGIVGDVDLEDVAGKAWGATPTPGGTGPVTVSSMFLNLYKARMLQEGLKVEFNDEILGSVYGERGGN
jgi:methylenetetrahydrofolate dehydrogenase (NADP+) / methenyltetrahydrofolate cyclohydrolase